jgi:hypothetical protein
MQAHLATRPQYGPDIVSRGDSNGRRAQPEPRPQATPWDIYILVVISFAAHFAIVMDLAYRMMAP